jgi:hypothetical protein
MVLTRRAATRSRTGVVFEYQAENGVRLSRQVPVRVVRCLGDDSQHCGGLGTGTQSSNWWPCWPAIFW